MTTSLVSIIIVTYNNAAVIGPCLTAVSKQKAAHFEVIVVDNASQDNTVRIIQRYPTVHLIELAKNRGFTGGNIAGLQEARGDLIVLLNPDTAVDAFWLRELTREMESHPEVGICASKLLVAGTQVIDSAGDGCTTTGRGYKHQEGKQNRPDEQSRYVFGACGGAMMLRRRLIETIGFLDDDFFLIYEDTDLNFRAQLAGWKCLYVPTAIVHHKVRSSIGVLSDTAVYYSIRNSRLVWLKNMPGWLMIKYFHHFLIQEAGVFCFFCLKHGKWAAYWRANCDFLRLLPKFLKKRREIRHFQKQTNAELESLLTPIFDSRFVREKIKKLLG